MSKNKFLKDFFYVSIAQGLNYLVPLLLIPYVVRKLGPENFGAVSFYQAFAQYFTLIINFGFDLSAVREMSALKTNEEKAKLFSDVFFAKLILFGISTLLFTGLSLIVGQFRENFTLNLFCFIINIGFLFYSAWFFQVTGKMRVAVVFNGIFKVLMAILVIFFVTDQADVKTYSFIFSIMQVAFGVTTFLYIIRKWKFDLRFNFSACLFQMKESIMVFLSSVAITLYTNTNVFLLGLLSDDASTGFFSGASKLIYGAVYLIFVPFSLILYPKVSAAIKEDEKKGIEMLKTVAWIALFMGLIMSVGLFLSSKLIILTIYGQQYHRSIIDFQILSALPLLLAMGNIFVVQGMINLKMDKKFLTITFIGASFCVLFNYFLMPYLKDIAAALALVLTELFIMISGYFILRARIGNPLDMLYLAKVKNIFKEKTVFLKGRMTASKTDEN